MRNFPLKLAVVAVLAALCTAGRAGTLSNFFTDFQKAREEGKFSHVVDIDNDTLLMNRNDGFYSSGMRYSQVYSLRDAGQVTNFGWRIGQDLYTASDIKLPPERVGPPDHPYAGWLYAGAYKEVRRADGTHTRVGVDIGCLGPCAGGEWTQTNFHRLISQPLPRGWSKQVKNEAGVVLYGEFAPVRWAPAATIDLTPRVVGRFGNIFTDVGGGLTMRFGQLDALPDGDAFYGYARADLSAVGYNATLQGGYFSKNNPHTVKPKRLVGEAEIGVLWRSGAFGATAGVVRRSNEIRDLPNSVGAQNYVRLQFSYTP